MKAFIHIDVDEEDNVNIDAQGDVNEIVMMIVDVLCATAGQFEIPAKDIVKAVDNELEDWE